MSIGTQRKTLSSLGFTLTEKGHTFEFQVSEHLLFSDKEKQCINQRLFQCSNGIQSIPYTLACNHYADCQDVSDEGFCNFPCKVRDF